MIDVLLLFVIVWLLILSYVGSSKKEDKDKVKEIDLIYAFHDIPDDRWELNELEDEQDAQDVLDILFLEETDPE